MKAYKFKCKVCGNVYQGKEEPEFCPKCGASRDQMEEISGEELFEEISGEERLISNQEAGTYMETGHR